MATMAEEAEEQEAASGAGIQINMDRSGVEGRYVQQWFFLMVVGSPRSFGISWEPWPSTPLSKQRLLEFC